MDKLKKVGLTALGTALVSTSAVAADYKTGGRQCQREANHTRAFRSNDRESA